MGQQGERGRITTLPFFPGYDQGEAISLIVVPSFSTRVCCVLSLFFMLAAFFAEWSGSQLFISEWSKR